MSKFLFGKEKNLKNYTSKEVGAHNTVDSAWIIYDKKVYDVTEFLSEHPGGAEILLELAGKDATVEFDTVRHSPEAQTEQETYLIGNLVDE